MTRKSFTEAISSPAINTPKVRLYNEAMKHLRSSGGKPLRAHESFHEAIRKDPDLLCALLNVTWQQTFDLSISYLRERADEMNGSAVAKAASGGGGQPCSNAQATIAPAAPTKSGSNAGAGETGLPVVGTHNANARPSALPIPPKAGGGGQLRTETQAAFSSPSTPAWTKSDIPVREHTRKPPSKAQIPMPRVPLDRQLAAHNRHADSILVTLKVRGRPIGQWTGEEAMAQSETSLWESRVLKVFGQGIPPNSKIGDILDEEEANRRWKWVETSSAA